MEPIDIIIIVAFSFFTIFVVVKCIINKKKGKTSCGCNCSSCSACKNKHCQNKGK